MTTMRRVLTALLIFLAGPALAQERPVLVELFTSQGCSSCPPADALLRELSGRDNVVALALHVDYWDYIGWKDSFARPGHAVRQRGYARASGRSMVYTPQMIVNGRDDVMGSHPRDVAEMIETHAARPGPVTLTASRQDGRLAVTARTDGVVDGTCEVHLVRYRPRSTVSITRGENAGRTMTYANVVTDMTVLANWDMRAPLSLDVPIAGDLPAAILLQHDGHGPVEAVAIVE